MSTSSVSKGCFLFNSSSLKSKKKLKTSAIAGYNNMSLHALIFDFDLML